LNIFNKGDIITDIALFIFILTNAGVFFNSSSARMQNLTKNNNKIIDKKSK
jgi:hypothetical protein